MGYKQRSLRGKRNKIILVQIGRKFFTLKYHLTVMGAGDLKRLIDSKKYDLRLLREEDD